MSNTIAVDDLRVGMFIQLDGGWLSHPFPLSSFRIASPEQIATLRGLGLKQLRWVPEKSDLPELGAGPGAAGGAAGSAAAPAPAGPSLAELAAQRRREALLAQREAAQRCERQHAEAAAAWRAACEGVGPRPQEAGRAAQQLTDAILHKMLGEAEIGIRLVAGAGDRAAAHALNVGVIALLIGRTMGLEADELAAMGTGALMHDVGKLDVPDRFRHAEDGFTSAETAAYRDHVAKGAQLGQRMQLSAGALAVLAQHHEHADGSGFPMRLAGERISMAARIVALVNRYDNLCNPQSRTIALTPHEAVSVLFAQGRARYDNAVLNAFIRMMGVYPAGSLVQLTDDRYAMVVGVNSSRPLKPRVLVHDAKVPRSEALLLDLERMPDLGIRRSLPANRLPPAVVEYLDPRPRVSYYFEPLSAHGELEMAA
jgi:HD-GYP domain-containing protein (c-di-GMP phosphodiesterase class II)